MNKAHAKAFSLTILHRKDSPPGILDRHIKQLVSRIEEVTEHSISDSLERLFWHPPEISATPTCAFSHDLYSEYAAHERNRLALATHVVHQVALHCLAQAQVEYGEFERALRERVLYFRPLVEFVAVEFPVAWEAQPTELEEQFKLPAGDAKHVLSVLEDCRATDLHVSFVQIEGLTSPAGPRAPLDWPEPPFRIRPARLAYSFLALLAGDKCPICHARPPLHAALRGAPGRLAGN